MVPRYRKLLGTSVKVFADVAVKHSAPLAPRDLRDEVEDTVGRGRADAIIVSGAATGKAACVEDVRIAKEAAGRTPVFVGSGVSLVNIAEMMRHADGLIVGSAFQKDGVAGRPVDPERVRALIEAARVV